MGLLMRRRLPNEKEIEPEKTIAAASASPPPPVVDPPPRTGVARLACTIPQKQQAPIASGDTTTAGDEDNESARVEALLQQMRQERAVTGDANHAGRLRGLLMRVWANTLQVLHKYDHVALTTLLQHQREITSRDCLEAFLEDAEGCSRPPLAAVMGTRLASPHESVWALTSLRILSQHSQIVRRHLERTNYAAILDKAVLVGSAVHTVLETEAKLALSVWSEKR